MESPKLIFLNEKLAWLRKTWAELPTFGKLIKPCVIVHPNWCKLRAEISFVLFVLRQSGFHKQSASLWWMGKLQSEMIHKTAKGSFFMENSDKNVLHYTSPRHRTYLFQPTFDISYATKASVERTFLDAAPKLNSLILLKERLVLFWENIIIFLLWYSAS